MEALKREDLVLAEVSGGTGKGATSSSSSTSNSVVVINIGTPVPNVPTLA